MASSIAYTLAFMLVYGTWRTLLLFVAMLAVAGVFAAVVLISVRLNWRALDANRRHDRGLCPNCGYDVRATPDLCPECGNAVYPWRPLSRWQDRMGCWMALLWAAVFFAGIAGLQWLLVAFLLTTRRTL